MTHTETSLAIDRLASAALIDGLAAELIALGIISGDRLADRIERSADGREARQRRILLALARGLRRHPGPRLTVVDGGLAEIGRFPAAPLQRRET